MLANSAYTMDDAKSVADSSHADVGVCIIAVPFAKLLPTCIKFQIIFQEHSIDLIAVLAED